jgi:hypothetical protein
MPYFILHKIINGIIYIFQVWFGHSNVVLNPQKTQQPGAMINSIIIVCAKKSSSNREIHHYNVEIMHKR